MSENKELREQCEADLKAYWPDKWDQMALDPYQVATLMRLERIARALEAMAVPTQGDFADNYEVEITADDGDN